MDVLCVTSQRGEIIVTVNIHFWKGVCRSRKKCTISSPWLPQKGQNPKCSASEIMHYVIIQQMGNVGKKCSTRWHKCY